jgi:NAD(P)-dependent dehydrogenase (short-subunit alcohol dehydrogenase family)
MSTMIDKVVIVTGGSSGIGRAAARRFAEAGAKVIITGRRAEALLDAAGDHPGISAFVADAGVSLDAARTVAKAIEVHGRLDVLVCNAGAGAILPLARATADQIMGILAVNVLGPSLLAVAALHLTRCWALELAPHGVRVNAIAPGPTDSGALTGMMGLSPEQAAAIEKQERERIPLGRRGNPDEVARWIIALADPVSEWVTGQVIAIDGGLGLA